jgi:hypothetical protein
VDNFLRILNKIHVALPLAVVGLPLGAVLFLGPLLVPLQILPYLVHTVVVCLRNVPPDRTMRLRSLAMSLALSRMAVVHGLFYVYDSKTAMALLRRCAMPLALHIAWMGVCWYMEQNADMAHHILLAPIPKAVDLDHL